MATKVLNTRFTVKKIEKPAEQTQVVSTGHFSSKDFFILLDYHSGLIELDEDILIDIILYKGHVKDEMVPLEYTYVMCGRVYQVEDDIVVGSFGGLRFILNGNLKSLDDKSDISIALRKL